MLNKRTDMKKIDCTKCQEQHLCCNSGAWVDLEEVKKILSLKLKGGFYHFEKDKSFPSGYKAGTSYGSNKCSFLTPKGLCSIHSISYDLKPTYCKEFPYEDGKLSSSAPRLCVALKTRKKGTK